MAKKKVNYLAMDRDELDAYLAEQEQPLIEELAKIDAAVLEAVNRKRAIRDERLALEQMRNEWLAQNRDPDAGPDQVIGR